MTSANLQITEFKAFVPAKDFVRSIQYYRDIGFSGVLWRIGQKVA